MDSMKVPSISNPTLLLHLSILKSAGHFFPLFLADVFILVLHISVAAEAKEAVGSLFGSLRE